MLALAAVVACAAGCSAPVPVDVRVSPESVEAAPRQPIAFHADVRGTFDAAVSWSVELGPGTIDSAGLYRGPDIVPPDSANLVVVRATLSTGESGDATLRIVPLPMEPLRGPRTGGTEVTIRGPGAVEGAHVFFDGVQSPEVVVESSFAIRATAPPGTRGPADVRIETPGGTIVEYPASFGYGATALRSGQWQRLDATAPCGPPTPIDADLDGDDDLVSSGCNGSIQTLVNAGDGTFTNGPVHPVGATYQLAVADRDGDGDLDLWLLDYLEENRIFDATPAGLVEVPDAGLPLYTYNYVITDANGDGRGDLVGRDDVRLALPGGGFAPVMSFAVPGTFKASGPAARDVDGDGFPELFFSGATGTTAQICVFPGIDGQTFGAPETHVVSVGAFDSVTDLVPGDHDGDGISDLVVLRSTQPNVGFMKGNLDGTLGAVDWRAGSFTNSRAAALDVDGDGYLDLQLGGTILWGSAGGPTAPIAVTRAPTGSGLSFAQLDGDGLLDAVALQSILATLVFPSGPRMFDPPGDLVASPAELAAIAPAGEGNVFVARTPDADGNGAVMIVSLENGPGAEVLLESGEATGLRAADTDLDGDPDVLAIDPAGALWIVDASPDAPEPATRIAFAGPVLDADAGNLDGDGLADLAVVVQDTSTAFAAIEIVWGSGERQTLDGGSRPMSVVIADLDADGTPEIVAADDEGLRILVFALEGASYSLALELPLGTTVPKSVAVRDLDGDTFPEILAFATGPTFNEIAVWNGAPGLFYDSPRRFRNAGVAEEMALLDFDGDAKLDVLLMTSFSDSVLLRGTGTGELLDPLPVPRDTTHSAIVPMPPPAGDSRWRLAAIARTTGHVVLLENESR